MLKVTLILALIAISGCRQSLSSKQVECRVSDSGGPELDEDCAILELVARHVLQTGDFVWRQEDFGPNSQILIDSRSNGNAGFLSADQITGELGETGTRTISAPMIRSLGERNREIRPWDGLRSSDGRVVAVDLSQFNCDEFATERDGEPPLLINAYPRMAVYIDAWRPGFSENGSEAVLRFMIGPGPHASACTYFLEKKQGKWHIKWWKYSYFA